MNHDVLLEPQHLIEEHMAFGATFEMPLQAGWRAHTNSKDPARRLKIGFVSGDLCGHALTPFLEPAFKALSTRPLLELHAYTTRVDEDETTKRLRWYFAGWHAVTDLTSEQLAEQIRGDGIDILIDLSGHTARNRLLTFALKPAPVQVGWVGYLGTSGMKAMDYYLCDAHWLPRGQHAWQFTEQLVYLPSSVVFAPDAHAPPVNRLPALRNGYVTFGSFNRVSKINDAVLALWAMLMNRVPNSRLLMGGIEEGSRSAIQETLAVHGIGAERLAFFPRQGMGEYLALHHKVDICLDTYPHGGGATTAHAAWMGVPTLCLTGETVPSRFGASLMHHLNMGAFVATDIAGYVEAGAQWAQQPEQLAEIRAGMRARFVASHLGQHQSFALDLEHSLRAMWTHWCSGQEMAPQRLGLRLASSPTNTLKPVEQVRVVSASQLSEPEFWASSALGQSLREHMARDPRVSLSVACSNRQGLSEIFNNAIAEHPDPVLVFVHDDVWIDEPFFVDTVLAGLQQFDVIGVAGNRRLVPGQPAWPFVDLKFTWDTKANLSGRVAHGKEAHGPISAYGPTPASCALLDGVFIATRCSTLRASGVRFDAQFDFHFYDLDFCRTASQAGLQLGSWPIALTHQSGGAFGSSAWQQKFALYAAKWGEPAPPIGETAMRTQNTPSAASADSVVEALAAAAEFEATDQLNYAIKVYEEILKFNSNHGEALYRLGKIAQRLNAFTQAAQYLQSAVQSDSSSEKYWLGFIHHLMMTQAPGVVQDAIELGLNHGLTEETAGVLQTILASDTHARAKKRAAIFEHMTAGNASQPTVKFCPVCSNDVTVFLPLSADYQRTYAQFNQAHPIDRYETLNLLEYACPHCTASDRDRLMASYFLHDRAVDQSSASRRILEIAPSRSLAHLLRSHGTEYRSADLFDPVAMDRVDITNMNIYPEGRFDWVICSHVLEHVMDDAAALREIHRILAPGGKAILLVPIPLDLRTIDELSASEDATEAERVRRFGQNDHIRMYSKQGFAQRIRKAGFDLTLVDQAYFPAGTFEVLGLQESACLYIAVRAGV